MPGINYPPPPPFSSPPPFFFSSLSLLSLNCNLHSRPAVTATTSLSLSCRGLLLYCYGGDGANCHIVALTVFGVVVLFFSCCCCCSSWCGRISPHPSTPYSIFNSIIRKKRRKKSFKKSTQLSCFSELRIRGGHSAFVGTLCTEQPTSTFSTLTALM